MTIAGLAGQVPCDGGSIAFLHNQNPPWNIPEHRLKRHPRHSGLCVPLWYVCLLKELFRC